MCAILKTLFVLRLSYLRQLLKKIRHKRGLYSIFFLRKAILGTFLIKIINSIIFRYCVASRDIEPCELGKSKIFTLQVK